MFATVLSIRAVAHAANPVSERQALVGGFDDAFWVATALALIGLALSFILPISRHDPKVPLAKPHPHVVIH